MEEIQTYVYKNFPFSKLGISKEVGKDASRNADLRCHEMVFHLLAKKYGLKGDISEIIKEFSLYARDKPIMKRYKVSTEPRADSNIAV